MEQKKHIAVIVENLPVPLDRRVWQESCALRDMGYEVSVICPQMRGYTEAYEVLEGIHIYRHPISDEAGSLAGFFLEYASALIGEFKCLRKVSKRQQIDAIHLCNPPDILVLNAIPYRLFQGVPILFDVHDVWPEMFEAKFSKSNPIYWMVRMAEKLTLSFSKVVIATNESVKDIVQSRCSKKDDEFFVVRTSPQSIDLNAAVVPERKNGRDFLVGYIGVIGDADGVGYLIEAADHVVNTLGRKDIQFCLMGSGPDWQRVKDLRDEKKLEDFVEMPGRVSDQYLSETLTTMDMGVACDPINTYNDHCTMNKTLEYMAFGKAQVLFGIREGRISAGDAAEYVMENSGVKLGDAIVKLMDDPEKRKKMGAIGKERLAGELSWEFSTQQLKKAYQKLFE